MHFRLAQLLGTSAHLCADTNGCRRVHFMRNALAHAGKTLRRTVNAAIGAVFVQESADAARAQWRTVADQLRCKSPKLGTLMGDAENDVLVFMYLLSDALDANLLDQFTGASSKWFARWD